MSLLLEESDILAILKKLEIYIDRQDPGKGMNELSGLCFRLAPLEDISVKNKTEFARSLISSLEPIFDFLFQTEEFDSTMVAILMDSISALIENGYSPLKIEIKSLIFFDRNFEGVIQSIFSANNIRLSAQILNSISRIARSKIKLEPELQTKIVTIRSRLVKEIIKYRMNDFGSRQELCKVIYFMLESRDIGCFEAQAEIDFIEENVIEAVYKQIDNTDNLPLLVALARTNTMKKSQFKMLEQLFCQKVSRYEFRLQLRAIDEKYVQDWLANIDQMQKLMPKMNAIIMRDFIVILCKNFRILENVLRDCPLHKGSMLAVYLDELISKMLSERSKFTIGERYLLPDFLKFAPLAIYKLSNIGEFSDFKLRDKLCKKFIKGILLQEDLGDLLDPISNFITSQNLTRMNDSSEIEDLVKHVHKWVSANQRSAKPKKCQVLAYNILKTEIPQPENYIEPFVRVIIQNFQNSLQKRAHFNESSAMTLIALSNIWLFRLRSKQQPDDIENQTVLLECIEMCHIIFTEASKAKVDLGVHVMHQYALLCDFCVLFEVYKSDLKKSQKVKATADQLIKLLSSISIKSTKLTNRSNYLGKGMSSEEIFQSVLEKLQIPFKREMRIRLFDVDFFLPSINTVVELDGLIHYTRSNRIELIKTVMKREYLKRHGYKFTSFSGLIKSQDLDLKTDFEREIKILLEDHANPKQTEEKPASTVAEKKEKKPRKKANAE